VDRHDGELAASRVTKLAEHLARGCTSCETQIAGIERTLSAVAAGPLPAAPRAVTRRAAKLFTRRRRAEAVDGLRRVLARLVFDEGRELAGALRAAPGASRRILWIAGEHELFTSFVAGRAGWDLLGEVMPVEDDDRELAGEIALIKDGREISRCALDADGRFTFRSLASGGYSMLGTVDGTPFEVPTFSLD
jgi:hypothetical protein